MAIRLRTRFSPPTHSRESWAALLASQPRKEWDKLLAPLSLRDTADLLYEWGFWARPDQYAPLGQWLTWVINGGRGYGKTRAGAEWVQQKAEDMPGSHGALVSITPGDARDVMIEGGESSILKIARPSFRPEYEPSKRRLTWPNGTTATIYSSKEYEQLRGPQHHWAWCDELCAWHYPRETWDMLQFGLRLGDLPQSLITTTPKPITIFREILEAKTTVVTGGSSYENRANLSASWFAKTILPYEGTALGGQEIYARIMDSMEGALWKRPWFDDNRVKDVPGQLIRTLVSIDPAGTAEEESNETGIGVAAIARVGKLIHGYVLEDGSGRYTPDGWARKAISLYDKWGADCIVAEANQGGDMVEHTLRTGRNNVPFRRVWASKSKQARAEPISRLYERGMVHHVGVFAALEDQCCTWEPVTGAPSPDRLDWLVWALTELMLGTPEIVAPNVDALTQQSYWRNV